MMLKDTEEPYPLSNFVTDWFIALLLRKLPEVSRSFLHFKKTIRLFSGAFLKNRSFNHKILFGKKLRTADINVEQYLV